MVGKTLVIGLIIILFASGGLCSTIVTLEDAEELIDTNENLVIIDCRSCKCDYDKSHIPNAIWMYYPNGLYNTTYDCLVYGEPRSENFTRMLSENTTSNVYHLKNYQSLLVGGSENPDEEKNPILLFFGVTCFATAVVLYLYDRRKGKK